MVRNFSNAVAKTRTFLMFALPAMMLTVLFTGAAHATDPPIVTPDVSGLFAPELNTFYTKIGPLIGYVIGATFFFGLIALVLKWSKRVTHGA